MGVKGIQGFTAVPLKERFWSHVNKNGANGCWEWSPRNKARYGRIKVNKTDKNHGSAAHRVAYEVFVGPIPKGMEVCHTCDNGYCVNPKHLFLGTHRDNMDDMKRKGRKYGLTGEFSSSAKLTWEQVNTIRSIKGLYSAQELAKDFNVCARTIRNIWNNKVWKDCALKCTYTDREDDCDE